MASPSILLKEALGSSGAGDYHLDHPWLCGDLGAWHNQRHDAWVRGIIANGCEVTLQTAMWSGRK